jgi:hypothetical protein
MHHAHVYAHDQAAAVATVKRLPDFCITLAIVRDPKGLGWEIDYATWSDPLPTF